MHYLRLFIFLFVCGTGCYASPVAVVATTSIVADWVQNIGGEHIELEVLAGGGVDAHTFELMPRQWVALQEADIVFGIGLGLEDAWFSSSSLNHVHWLGENADPFDYQGVKDPHVWMDVLRVQAIVRVITDVLSDIDEEHKVDYERNRDAYLAQLRDLDAWMMDALSPMSQAEDGGIVTGHNNLAYLASRYGLSISGVINVSVTSDAPDPSARHFAKLIDFMRAQSVRVACAESGHNNDLILQLCGEVEFASPAMLSVESLEAGGHTDYIDMMRSNVQAINRAYEANN